MTDAPKIRVPEDSAVGKAAKELRRATQARRKQPGHDTELALQKARRGHDNARRETFKIVGENHDGQR